MCDLFHTKDLKTVVPFKRLHRFFFVLINKNVENFYIELVFINNYTIYICLIAVI
jgi:hypothetical protein